MLESKSQELTKGDREAKYFNRSIARQWETNIKSSTI
jgi:hypothetical protein